MDIIPALREGINEGQRCTGDRAIELKKVTNAHVIEVICNSF